MRPALMLPALRAGACARAPPAPPAAPLATEGESALAARLAVRYGGESFSGSLSWRHARSSDEMLISSAFAQGVARIGREGDVITLTPVEPREYRAADAESLTEQALGFRLPLAGLAEWVRARPSPSSPALTDKASDGRLRSLEQNGWKIEYLEYAAGLPSRLRLNYPGVELRLAITQWK